MVRIATVLIRRGEPGYRDAFHARTGHWPGCPHVYPGRDLPPCECKEPARC